MYSTESGIAVAWDWGYRVGQFGGRREVTTSWDDEHVHYLGCGDGSGVCIYGNTSQNVHFKYV